MKRAGLGSIRRQAGLSFLLLQGSFAAIASIFSTFFSELFDASTFLFIQSQPRGCGGLRSLTAAAAAGGKEGLAGGSRSFHTFLISLYFFPSNRE